MTRLATRIRKHAAGWVGGVLEETEPDRADAEGDLNGTLDRGEHFIASETGRLVVRGGSATRQRFHSAGSTPLTSTLAIFPYSQCGAVAIGHESGAGKHYLYRLDSAGAFATAVESTSRHDLGWDTSEFARPVAAEYYERIFLADATMAYGSRRAMKVIDPAGTVTTPEFDLDGDPATPVSGAPDDPVYPYCVAAFAGFLFMAGYDSEAGGDAPDMLRHNKLGEAPDSATFFEPQAFARVGAVGQRIHALAPGDNMMLVAKQHELYRVAEGPILYGGAGWQFSVQQLDASRAFGVSNPYALLYRKPYWYGIGDAGPFRTDGAGLDALVGTRRRTWRRLKNIHLAWVAFHSERDAILFGVPVADDAANPDYPSLVMVWDIRRECWMPDWPLGRQVTHAQAITTPLGVVSTLPIGTPTGIPSVPIQVFDDTVPTPTSSSVRITFTAGDASSQTEVWIRTVTSGAVFQLWTTLAAAVVQADLTGLAVLTLYQVELRHRKGTSYSAYGPIGGAQTGGAGLTIPGVPVQTFSTTTPTSAVLDCTFTPGDTTSQTEVWEDPGAGFSLVQTLAAGVTSFQATGGVLDETRDIKLRHKQGAIYSQYSAATTVYFAASGSLTAPSALAQVVNGLTPSTTVVDLVWSNGDATAVTEIWRRLPAGTSVYVSEVAAGVTAATVTQPSSTKYLYKLRHRKLGAFSSFTSEVPAWLRLAPPFGVTVIPQDSTTLRVYFVNKVDNANLILYRYPGLQIVSLITGSWTGVAIDTTLYTDDPGRTTGVEYGYVVAVYDNTWPVGLQQSFSDPGYGTP